MLFESDHPRIAESRARMISFRVTTEEFERLRRLCRLKGLRNVSEVIRLAVNELLSGDQLATSPAVEFDLQDRVDQLELRLAYLESQVAPKHALA